MLLHLRSAAGNRHLLQTINALQIEPGLFLFALTAGKYRKTEMKVYEQDLFRAGEQHEPVFKQNVVPERPSLVLTLLSPMLHPFSRQGIPSHCSNLKTALETFDKYRYQMRSYLVTPEIRVLLVTAGLRGG